MRYYVYISDAKIDMLLPQIPRTRRTKIQREIGVDWKLLSAKQTTELDTEEHRTQRLLALEGYLRENEKIGSPSDPSPWIADELQMSWGPLWGLFSDRASDNLSASSVWFAGIKRINEQPGLEIAVGLGGSAAHLIGSKNQAEEIAGDSLLYGISASLREVGVVTDEDLEEANGLEEHEQLLYSASRVAQVVGHSAPQRVEFLAKHLISGTIMGADGPDRVVVGTPLYVALVD